jgi:GPI-anchor transamidase subunit T
LEKTAEKGWSLTEVFGRGIKGACPLIDKEIPGSMSVCLRVPHDRDVFITAGAFESKNPDGFSRCYRLPSPDYFDLVLPEQELQLKVPLEQPVLHAERTIIGHGQERGGMQVILRNPSNTNPVDFIYFESLPWFMRPYLHTLQARLAGIDGLQRQVPVSDIIGDIFFRPAIDRERGTQLELVLSVPPASTVTLIYDIEKAILRYTEYPPDANRGFNVAPAVIRLLNKKDNSTTASPVYLRTTSILLPLPTPDFSMPYNVIILTSTVMALAFGSIFNLLVRRFIAADEVALGSHTLKARLFSQLVVLRDRLRGKIVKVE